MNETVKLLMSNAITHDTRRFVFEKPPGFDFEPGQGVELSINEPQWRDKGRPFTPTSGADDGVLEFMVKRYPGDESVTERLHALNPGDEVEVDGPFGKIAYQGPGVFIAAGAGITPFIAIFRQLAAHDPQALEQQRLIFSNHYRRDLICGEELMAYLANRAFFTFTRESGDKDTLDERIDLPLIQRVADSRDQEFYLCGPDAFVKELKKGLIEWGVEEGRIVHEG